MVGHLAGDAADVEPAGPAHPVVADHEQVDAELGGGGHDRNGRFPGALLCLGLDPEAAGPLHRCSEDGSAPLARPVIDVDQDQLRPQLPGEAGRGGLGHTGGG